MVTTIEIRLLTIHHHRHSHHHSHRHCRHRHGRSHPHHPPPHRPLFLSLLILINPPHPHLPCPRPVLVHCPQSPHISLVVGAPHPAEKGLFPKPRSTSCYAGVLPCSAEATHTSTLWPQLLAIMKNNSEYEKHIQRTRAYVRTNFKNSQKIAKVLASMASNCAGNRPCRECQSHSNATGHTQVDADIKHKPTSSSKHIQVGHMIEMDLT